MAKRREYISFRYQNEPAHAVSRWFNYVLVACPSCSGMTANKQRSESIFDRRITCTACGFVNDFRAESMSYGDQPLDPFTDNWLWLSRETRKGWLFAFNYENLFELIEFVSSKHRERNHDVSYGWSNRAYFSRLPAWIKAGSNRNMILHNLKKVAAKGYTPTTSSLTLALHSKSLGFFK